MPIYNISEAQKALEGMEEHAISDQDHAGPVPSGSKWFSSILARLFFTALFVLDIGWAIYAAALLLFGSVGQLLTWKKLRFFCHLQKKGWLSLKRALVCALALIAALFSPAFGIMVACTYFLMYDKAGLEEVVPLSLQEQFQEFFAKK